MRAILALTGIDLEARAIARQLELPSLAIPGFAAFGRGLLRVASVGIRAGCLESRWPLAVDGLGQPLVISAGLCGALDPALAPGDLVLPESVLGVLGKRLEVTAACHAEAAALAPSASAGLLVTTSEVVSTPGDKADLFARTGAIAADMESSMILAAAASAGLPSLVVRGVSDDARRALPPELLGLITPRGGIRIARAAALIARPAVLSSALGVHRATRRALWAVAALLGRLAA